MRAVVVDGFGAPPRLGWVDRPVPGPGEVLVRLPAAGVNPFDCKVVDGAVKDDVPHAFPLVLGSDGEQAAAGKLWMRLETEVGLADAPTAIGKAKARHAAGKTVITVV